MRQLDACDFCGDAPEGVFEVVPATVPDGPVRLALCADCRTTLQTVVDPLLDADGEPAESTGGSAAEPASEELAAEPTVDEPSRSSPPASDDAAGVTIEIEDDDETGGDETSADAGDDSADSGTAGGAPARRPDGYAQVIRLLQNREGAMPREDLRALATNAYDLGEQTFEDAVDAAIDNGDVEESAGGLRTT
ncbi:hypothetical protein [Halobacterium litoreum]|uniref:Uncharacterized protein n=1 Tax=Halobacterium litoreum TaxID=2039234 RepID=A0ABD5NEW0_9EURY|nr:hypothetical protein [Halobacterium litoreum]UHH13444.1 hypothetical protein LT972_00260 [Halobacterium litoreum]